MIKKFAIIENNIIVNIGIAEDAWPFTEQTSIELTDDQQASIGWSVKDGKIEIPYDQLPNSPVAITLSPTEIKYTFNVGNELAMHNHIDGGRHTTEIVEGEFKIIRNGKESTAVAGDKLKFTKTENHSVTAITAGSIINKTY